MSKYAAGDEVEYVGPDDGALKRGARGRVVQTGSKVATVDFGGVVGALPIEETHLRKRS